MVPLKQSTRNAFIKRRQGFLKKIRPTGSIVLMFTQGTVEPVRLIFPPL